MSDDAKPKRYRRRQRSRKKKSAITIESINPGRAPVGAVTLMQYADVRKPSVPGAWPEDPEEQNMLPSVTPTQLSILAASPRSITESRPLPSTPVLLNPDIFGSPSSLDPAIPPLSPSPSNPPIGAAQDNNSPLAPSPSPLPRIKACRSLPTLTTHGASMMYSRFSRLHRMSEQEELHELDGFNALASSQPVSLSQLCTRNSRLKTSRASKRLQLGSPDDHIASDNSTVVTRELDRYNLPTRLSRIHHANGECGLGFYKEGVLKSTRDGLERCSEMMDYTRQDPWYEQTDIHLHRNPLTYANDYDSPFTYPMAQPYGSTAGSPFVTGDQCRVEYGTWPADKTSKRLFSNPLPETPYASIDAEGTQRMESSLSLYRNSFDRQENQSPYESLRTQRSGYHPPNVREIMSNMQSPFAEERPEHHHIEYAAVDYDNMGQGVPCERRSHAGYSPSPESRVPSPMPSHMQTPDYNMHSRHFSESFVNKDIPSGQHKIQNRALSEKVAVYLHEITERPQFDAPQTKAECVFNGTKSLFAREHYSPEAITDNTDSLSSLSMDTEDPATKADPSLSIVLRSYSQSETVKPLPSRTSAIHSEASSGYFYEELMEKMAKSPGLGTLNSSDMGPRKIKPPPGIPDPVVRNTALGLSYLERPPSSVDARLHEANSWFHGDGRGEEQLRQQVTDIAENYATRIERLEGGDSAASTRAKQVTHLLGNVIINLHSYGSQDSTRDMGNFANFGRVKSRYCEPSLGSRRSYFDRDPSIDHWGFPRERTSSTSDRVDAYLNYSPEESQKFKKW